MCLPLPRVVNGLKKSNWKCSRRNLTRHQATPFFVLPKTWPQSRRFLQRRPRGNVIRNILHCLHSFRSRSIGASQSITSKTTNQSPASVQDNLKKWHVMTMRSLHATALRMELYEQRKYYFTPQSNLKSSSRPILRQRALSGFGVSQKGAELLFSVEVLPEIRGPTKQSTGYRGGHAMQLFQGTAYQRLIKFQVPSCQAQCPNLVDSSQIMQNHAKSRYATFQFADLWIDGSRLGETTVNNSL